MLCQVTLQHSLQQQQRQQQGVLLQQQLEQRLGWMPQAMPQQQQHRLQ
jgi:hypothetical protein